jgi:hypothetical protein
LSSLSLKEEKTLRTTYKKLARGAPGGFRAKTEARFSYPSHRDPYGGPDECQTNYETNFPSPHFSISPLPGSFIRMRLNFSEKHVPGLGGLLCAAQLNAA